MVKMINSCAQRRGAGAALMLALFLALAGCGSTHSTSARDDQDRDLALMRRVMDRVQSSYVEPVKDDQLVKDSLKGMLTGLDPHSDYMDENEYREMLADSHGQFSGIGAELTRDDRRSSGCAGLPTPRCGSRSPVSVSVLST